VKGDGKAESKELKRSGGRATESKESKQEVNPLLGSSVEHTAVF
jgi:hypothetical protein